VNKAAKGKPFIIAKAGKPMVKVLPLSEQETRGVDKLGFMSGEILIPEDFDSLGSSDILGLFEGGPCEIPS
jgi:antitoxin (DNA-binding transcriptional repressor) of toxin-antitoxin stability system